MAGSSELVTALDYLTDAISDALTPEAEEGDPAPVPFPVYAMVDPASPPPDRAAAYASVVFLRRENTEPEELAALQVFTEHWTWYVYLVVVADGKSAGDVLEAVAGAEESIRAAIVGEKVDAFADGIRASAFEFAGFLGAGQVFRLVLTYHRFEG